jgi:putative ABC transport system permease protein
MTRLLQYLLRRLPIGWLQLSHNRMRLVAAVAGIAFANLLVFVQLGVVAAMTGVVHLTYTPFQADLLISSPRAQLFTGALVSRRVMYMALADPAVVDATPLYLNNMEWKRPDNVSKVLNVYGMTTEAGSFVGEAIRPQLPMLALPDRVLLDSQFQADVQAADTAVINPLSPGMPTTFEINGHAVEAVGSIKLGSGFGFDGALFVSDQTFQRLLPPRTAGTPNHILLRVAPGHDLSAVAQRLNARLAAEQVQVRTVAQAIADDVDYMNTEAPMGIIFGIGVFIGMLVGLVIVYQVLAADVAAHMREYATFKAMGYPHRFLLSIVFEEALIIALLGFVPGVVLGSVVYEVMAAATDLPLGMTLDRAVAVFIGTFVACSVSGALATLRLRHAEPAELFS